MNTPSSFPSAGPETRRSFLRKTATATAVVAATGFIRTPIYGQATAPSVNVIGANNKITVGHIGVGGQGLNAHVRTVCDSFKENNVMPVAVCDVSKTRVRVASEVITQKTTTTPEGFDNYQKLLSRKDIDAIFCATVDHWHTRVSVDALNAGKHVYVEKPMTRYLAEAFEIYDTVKKTGKILQVGSQGCSDMKWHRAAELIRAGKIGPIVMSQGSYMRNNAKGEWNYAIQDWCKPDDLNWDTWLGMEIKTRPTFAPDDYFRWRKYYPYCAGLLGDLFPHKLHPYMLATGNPEFPLRVSSIANKKVRTDRNTPGTRERDVPEIVQLIAEFPSGMTMHICSGTVNEQGTQEMIRGHKATLYMAGNRIEMKPEKPFTDEIEPITIPDIKPGESVANHHKNWFESIRGNKQPNAGIDLAIRVQTVISLAEMSERLNVMCLFDEKTRKVTTYTGHEVPALTYGSIKGQS